MKSKFSICVQATKYIGHTYEPKTILIVVDKNLKILAMEKVLKVLAVAKGKFQMRKLPRVLRANQVL